MVTGSLPERLYLQEEVQGFVGMSQPKGGRDLDLDGLSWPNPALVAQPAARWAGTKV